MESRLTWGRPAVSLEEVLSLLELVASKQPALLGVMVDTLATSPARPPILELTSFFKLKEPGELAAAVAIAARQLDLLEHNPLRRWKVPRDLFGDLAAPAIVLERFSQTRAGRWRSTRPGASRPAGLLRIDRRLKEAAGLERARALVDECLTGRAGG